MLSCRGVLTFLLMLLITVVCIRSPLLKYFAGVASVSQLFVSATLLVLAEGNYTVRVEGENLDYYV
jgi:hypothetical protein